LAAAVGRQVDALAERTRTEDPDALLLLLALDEKLADAFRVTVAGLRASGFLDREIGEQLGVSRQAVEQKWPRRSA
jgi:hypothetical protein